MGRKKARGHSGTEILRSGNISISIPSKRIDKAVEELAEQHREFQKKPPVVKQTDPDSWMVKDRAKPRFAPRWKPSGAKSGQAFGTVDYFGLTVNPSVRDVETYKEYLEKKRGRT